MKKILLFALVVLPLSFYSCELLDNLIPDVDTDFNKTFTVVLTSNSGYTEDELVDVTESDEYENFRDNIKGFKVNKITFQILDANIPDDMYFQGSINCSEETSGQTATAGVISRAKLLTLAEGAIENECELSTDETKKIVAWLDDPGKFKYNAYYLLTGESGNPYDLSQNQGYSFRLKIKFYVTVITGTGKS